MCATDMIFTLVQPINDLRIDLELNNSSLLPRY